MPLTETVIFTIEVTGTNKGSWYKDHIGSNYDVVLDNAVLGFHGPEICYKVLATGGPVRYIKIHHAEVRTQRIANQTEITKRYKNG